MKTYEKPRLMVLSFTANDAICTGCAAPTRGTGLAKLIEDTFAFVAGVNPNNDLTQDEISAIKLFALSEGCENEYQGYCKNTPAGMNVFTS